MQHWDDLRYLLALHENGSLINAAKLLKTNPTTVSRHIKRLSDTYKKTLVNRQPSGEWILTKDGEVFASIAKRCNMEIETLENEGQSSTAEVTISTTDFIAEHILAPQISDVLVSDEGLSLTLDMNDSNVSLAYGDADLAIRLGRPTSGKLVSSKIAEIEMNLFSKGGQMTKRWVGLPSAYDWVPEMQLALEFFGCQPVVRVNSFASIRDIALEHDLACIGPTFMLNGWNDLKLLNHFSEPATREVWSVFHESRKHDDALSRARKWAKDCFSALPTRMATLSAGQSKVSVA